MMGLMRLLPSECNASNDVNGSDVPVVSIIFGHVEGSSHQGRPERMPTARCRHDRF